MYYSISISIFNQLLFFDFLFNVKVLVILFIIIIIIII